MDKNIVNRNHIDFQLISVGIELVHKVLSLKDCTPELMAVNHHLSKAHELAIKWNEMFFEAYISKEGDI